MDFRKDKNAEIQARLTLVIAGFVSIALAVAGVLGLLWGLKGQRSDAEAELEVRAAKGADEITEALQQLRTATDQVWGSLSANTLGDKSAIEATLWFGLAEDQGLNGLMFANAPSSEAQAECPPVEGIPDADNEAVTALDIPLQEVSSALRPITAGESYQPYAVRSSGTEVLTDLDRTQYYCLDWYIQALAAVSLSANGETPGGVWVNPRLGSFSNTTLAFYSRAVVVDGEVKGVVLGTTAIDNLSSRADWSEITPHGYSFITAAANEVIAHPIGTFVESECRVGLENANCRGLGLEIPGYGNVEYFKDPITDQTAIYARSAVLLKSTQGLPDLTWDYWIVDIEASAIERTTTRTLLLQLTGFATLASLCLVVTFAAVLAADSGKLAWILSSAFAVTLLLLVGWLWWVHHTGPPNDDARLLPTPFSDPEGDDNDNDVVVGVFVQSLEFTGPNVVAASGLVWQSGPPNLSAVKPIFPEATSPPAMERVWGGEGEPSTGWQFTVTLRQEFNYGRFPLDREQIWLRVWPGGFTEPTTLLPDLDAYLIQAPLAKPGLVDDLVLEGWEVERSFFSVRRSPINTELGPLQAPPNQLKPGVSELYFVIDLRRNFVGPFVSQIIPLVAINLMLFAALLLAKPRRQRGVDAPDTLGTLAYVAALFFSVIISHNDLRSRLEATELVFLENFYFTTYLLLLLVSVNSLIPGSTKLTTTDLVDRSNLWPKLAYWPTFASFTLLATVWTLR